MSKEAPPPTEPSRKDTRPWPVPIAPEELAAAIFRGGGPPARRADGTGGQRAGGGGLISHCQVCDIIPIIPQYVEQRAGLYS